MEQLSHTAAVINLGKKLVKELNLDQSGNTLARWMAHYIAELILKSEDEKSLAKKAKLEIECCDTILKIWGNRGDLPQGARPLSNFTEVLFVLNALVRDKKSLVPWREYIYDDDHSAWGKFAKEMSENYDQIISISILANSTNNVLKKEKEWLDHFEFLSKEETEIIKNLDYLLLHENYSGIKIIYSKEQEDKEPIKERITQILDKLSLLVQKQFDSIEELKISLVAKSKNDYLNID